MPSLMTTLYADGAKRVAWTPEAVELAVESGLLDVSERFEIIDGELYSKMGQGWPHRFAIDALLLAFSGLDPALFHWSVQTPLAAGASHPEPDFHVIRGPLGKRTHLPNLSDAIFVVEVSDTSLPFDMRVKVPLYARSGIPVIWIVDLAHLHVIVHTRPLGGQYAEIRTFEAEDELPPPFEGSPPLSVSALFVDLR